MEERQLDALKILLRAGADVTLVDEATGASPLHFVVQRHAALTQTLLDAAAASGKCEAKIAVR